MNSLATLLSDYKAFLKSTANKDEQYKWEAINHFLSNWDIEARDFYPMFKNAFSRQTNLLYQNSLGFMDKAARHFPEEVRKMFINLYDENQELAQRISDFRKSSELILPDLKKATGKEKLSHQQDERTLSVYLSFKYPEKYYLFMNSFYQDFCEFIGVPSKPAGEKYLHFINIASEFKAQYIVPDSELLEEHRKINPDLEWNDQNLIVQNFIYTVISQGRSGVNYWIFQGNPDKYKIVEALNDDALKTWSVAAHKEKIHKGDKVILWITGNKAGCYALCEVSSEVEVRADDPDEQQYYIEPDFTGKRESVEMEIEYNFSNKPILNEYLKGLSEFKDFKGGNRGTNFMATKEQYNKILEINKMKETKRYWLYAPGENAEMWEEFYEQGIMGLGWEELGDLKQYNSKEEIVAKLQILENTTGSKKNDATANYEFINVMEAGDIVIVKKGRHELLGYGEVSSDYIFDDSRNLYKSTRKVNWLKKGKWPIEDPMALKTLTDISKYPTEDVNYEFYSQRLLGILNHPVNLRNMNYPNNQILFGPPGTGKTYNTINLAIAIANPGFDLTLPREEIKKEYDRLLKEGQIVFTTFHQSMSYEDFIEGIKPLKPLAEDTFLKYDIQPGIFYSLCEKAKSNFENSKLENKNKRNFEEVFELFKEDWEKEKEMKFPLKSDGYDFTIIGFTNTSIQFRKASGGTSHTLSIGTLKELYYGKVFNFKQGVGIYYPPVLNKILSYNIQDKISAEIRNFVLIIDEINRGNISQIFGELITLIEEDKRLGKKEALEVELPYSKEKFSVPSNLFIIGTMNTADRSIEALDTALRRRFTFIEMLPDPEMILDHGKTGGVVESIELVKLLFTINKRIEKLIDKDHQIGHSYFLSIRKFNDLVEVFKNKIIPLLEEYFYGDFGKIGLVLGEDFVVELPKTDFDFADFKGIDPDIISDLKERKVYHISDPESWSIDSFKRIYNS